MYSYIIEEGKEGDYARARLEGVDASVKDLVEVCGNIRYLSISDAVKLLELAAEGKVPIRYRSNAKRLGHRRELGGKKGRYPKKSAKIVLGVLKSALANAQQKGLSEELLVTHACANKVAKHMRYSPKGRRNVSALITARVEIVLKEKEGAKRPAKKAKKEEKPPAKVEEKPAPAKEEKPAEKAAPKDEKPAPAKVKEEKAAPEAKPPAAAEKPGPSKEEVKKSEDSKEKAAVKADMRAEAEQLEEKREDQMKDHPKKDARALPPGKKPAHQK